MKKLQLPLAVFAILILAGCGNNGRIVYAVDELADRAVADKEAFMGKEVVVSGYVAVILPNVDSNGYRLSLDFDLRSPTERQISCAIPQGKAPDGISSKWVTVKGQIANIHSQNYMGLKSVTLDPCEITSTE